MSGPDPNVLSPMQERYVYELLCDPKRHQTNAGIRAGFNRNHVSSQTSHLMRRPKIQEAIAKGEKQIQKITGITPERIMAELAKIGFANLQDYAEVTENGGSIKDIPREAAAAITELQSEATEGRGVSTRKSKIKLADKRAALVDMGKQIGMWKHQIEVSGSLDFVKLVEQSLQEVEVKEPLLLETSE